MPKGQKIKNAYIVYKKSVYQKFILDEKNQHLKKLMSDQHPTVKNLLSTHKQHLRAIQKVEQALKKHGIKYKISGRNNLQSLKGYDLIITIGGDGTVLRASQYITHQMILGINSVPKVSVGALCSIQIQDIKEKFEQLADGDFKIKKLQRIRIKVNNTRIPYEPINDVLFTNISPAGTSRYLIATNGKKEEHKSSGLWVSTPIGSTAAILAAGGKKQTLNQNNLQFFTREPYQGIYNPYSLTKGFVPKGKKLTITSKMIKSRLYLDGPTTFRTLEYGDKVSFEISPEVVKMVA